MNFFEKQAQAHRATLRLLLYFFLAIVSMIAILNLIAFAVVKGYAYPAYPLRDWFSEPFWYISGGIIVIVGGGTAWRLNQLSQGGKSLAILLGASPVASNTRLPQERMLLNLIEEMSIASGVPMPTAFILHNEKGINAFVAGYALEDMTLTVSQGALEQLSRDELQGVIAHEFSHIHNADTRLNIQLVSILAGILLIGALGGFICRSALNRSYFRRSRDSRGTIIALGAGTALYIVGYTGLFFGRLIQAAISRQRELLADSSAVQFTRNPDGIGNALFKIGYHKEHSYLTSTAKAQDVNHMCFGESLKLQQWFASHPPIEERLKSIDPKLLSRLRARFNAQKITQRTAPDQELTAENGISQFAPSDTTSSALKQDGSSGAIHVTEATTATPLQTKSFANLAGTMSPESQQWAATALSRIRQLFLESLNNPEFCELILYALVLRETGLVAATETQLKISTGQTITSDHPDLAECQTKLNKLKTSDFMPLLEVVVACLKDFDVNRRSSIIHNLKALVAADQKTTFNEFVLLSFAARHLLPRKMTASINKMDEARNQISLLLSMFAQLGAKSTDGRTTRGAESLFAEVSKLHLPLTQLDYKNAVSAAALELAINQLSLLNPLLKPSVIDACADCVLYDQEVSAREYQLLRLVIELLDCPMPPVIPG